MGRLSREDITSLTSFKNRKFKQALRMQKDLKGCGPCADKVEIDSNNHSTKAYNSATNTVQDCNFCRNNFDSYAFIVDEWKGLDMLYAKYVNYQQNYSDALMGLDKYFALRNNELGWVDALLTPASGLLIETKLLSRVAKDNASSKLDREKQAEALLKTSQTLRLAKAKNVSKDEAQKIEKDNITNSKLGYLSGKLVWMMFPGATAIKDFIEGVVNKILTILSPFILIYFGIAGAIGLFAGSFLNTISAYATTVVLMEWTFALIPLMVISVASIITITSYMVTLCKYFYISPFVIAWAMATRRVDKIIDFLLVGIAIFFKPVLIVLFIYLSLFLYSMVNDFFIYVALEQFSGILFPETNYSIIADIATRQNAASDQMKQAAGIKDWTLGALNYVVGTYAPIFTSIGKMLHNFHLMFILGAISGLIKIFGSLAGSYVAWKLIVNGPSWALGLIGLDGKHDDMISQGLESNLARRAFVA